MNGWLWRLVLGGLSLPVASQALSPGKAFMADCFPEWLNRRVNANQDCITGMQVLHDQLDLGEGDTNMMTVLNCDKHGGRLFQFHRLGNETRFFDPQFLECAPKACALAVIQNTFLMLILTARMCEHGLLREAKDEATVSALLKNSRIRLEEQLPALQDENGGRIVDFVVAGFPHSGSTTLLWALGRHPKIVLQPYEDNIFWTTHFTRRGVRQWYSSYKILAAKKRAALNDPNATLFFGIKDPLLIQQAFAMRMAINSGAKLIFLVREPTSWAESVLRHGQNYYNAHGDLWSIELGLSHALILSYVLQRSNRSRTLIVPTLALALDPDLAWKRLMLFLGLDFQPGSGVQMLSATRNHSMTDSSCFFLGNCLDLCSGDEQLRTLRAGLNQLYTIDKFHMFQHMRRTGWPARLTGMIAPKKCGESAAPPDPHLDSNVCGSEVLADSSCFDSETQCQNCCVWGFCQGHAPHDVGWPMCCYQLYAAYEMRLRKQIRSQLCPGGVSKKMGCCRGKASLRLCGTP